MKKYFLVASLLFLGSFAGAHDEGHGPKLTGELGLHKGALAAVIDKSEMSKGAGAALIYKGELVRTSDKIYVYIFSPNNLKKPLDLSTFSAKGSALLAVFKGEKQIGKTVEIELERNGGMYVGTLPKIKGTYHIDVSVKAGEKDLFVAFDGLK